MRSVLIMLGMAMTALGATAASAQTKDATFFTVTYIEAAQSAAKDATEVLKAYRDAGRKDAGNVRFELTQGIHRRGWFTVLGAWSDQKAFEAHAAAAHTKQMNDKLAPLLVAPNDTRQHNGLSVAAPTPGRSGICAVTHVDVIPPQRDNGVAAVKQLSEDSRKHDGNILFVTWQQTNRPNHFTVVECWKSRKAYDAHVSAPQTKDFRNKLVSMTGALYDERLYRVVQ